MGGGIFFFVGQCQLQCFSSKLQVGKVQRKTDRSEGGDELDPADEEKTFPWFTLKCNMEPKTIMVWKMFFSV